MKPLRIALLGLDPWMQLAAKALARMGHSVLEVDLSPNNSLPAIENQLKEFQPHFGLGRNFYPFDVNLKMTGMRGQSIQEIIARLKIPCALWYVDDPAVSGSFQQYKIWQKDPAPSNMFFFVMDRYHLPFFQSRGLPCAHLPIAVDRDFATKAAHPAPHGAGHDVCFAGTPPEMQGSLDPVDDQKIIGTCASGFASSVLQNLKPLLAGIEGQDLDSLQNLLVNHIRQFFSTWYSKAPSYLQDKEKLVSLLDSTLPRKRHEDLFWQLDTYYSLSQLCLALSRLRAKKIRIYGGEGWRTFFGNYQDSYPKLDLVEELPSLLSSSKINFCYTKWQFPGAVHERTLISLACGGFPLVNDRGELGEMFRPGEVASYQTLEEAEDRIDYYLKHESERQTVLSRGRERVLSNHTYDHRVKALIEIVSRHWNL